MTQFCYIKVGYKGVYIIRTCFPDDIIPSCTTKYKSFLCFININKTYLINFEDENYGKLRFYTDYKITRFYSRIQKAIKPMRIQRIYKIYTCTHAYDSNIMAKTVQ